MRVQRSSAQAQRLFERELLRALKKFGAVIPPHLWEEDRGRLAKLLQEATGPWLSEERTRLLRRVMRRYETMQR